MPTLKGSETEKNLLTAFAGESQARNRYGFYAKVAKKEGFEQISAIFLETAEQEKAHASRLFKFLEGGEVTITAGYPAGKIGSTVENLREAAGGEGHEWNTMYPEFAETARTEGFTDIALVLDNIAVAERRHGARFTALADALEAGTTFKRAAPITWVCRNCGWNTSACEAVERCPACNHPKAYFEEAACNW